MPPAPRTSALRARPVPPFHTFYFFAGDFLKIEWAKRDSVGFLSRQEVGVIRGGASDLFYYICVQWLKGGTLGIRLGLFPLGLRAPKYLGVSLILANAPCRDACSGDTQFGEGKESSPQLRAPPRSGRTEFTVPHSPYLSPKESGSLVCAFGNSPRRMAPSASASGYFR